MSDIDQFDTGQLRALWVLLKAATESSQGDRLEIARMRLELQIVEALNQPAPEAWVQGLLHVERLLAKSFPVVKPPL